MNYDEIEILKNIETGYDQMAGKFSSTRNFFWKDLVFLADYVSEKDKILDFGCGNGRLLEILEDKNAKYWGVDISSKLVEMAQKKYPQHNFRKIEAQESLPFSPDFFNVIFSIAVFHHFPPKYQMEKIKELHDLLESGGKIILTVWNLQDKYSEKEVTIPFQNNEGAVFKRYHYVFSQNEMKNLLEKAGFQVERCDTINGKNIVVCAKKP